MPDRNLRIRRREATNQDKDAVRGIVFGVLSEYGLKPDPADTDADLEDLELSYFRRGGVFYVLEDSGRIVGCGGLYRLDSGEFEIRKMYLQPEARGNGEGRRLLEKLLEDARDSRATRVVLETATVLVEAIALYERYGFQRIENPCLSSRCDQAYALDLMD